MEASWYNIRGLLYYTGISQGIEKIVDLPMTPDKLIS